MRLHFATGDQARFGPVVANGVAYGHSREGTVYAIDTLTGGKRGEFATEEKARSTPVVADGLVSVCSLEGNVYAMVPLSPNSGVPQNLTASIPVRHVRRDRRRVSRAVVARPVAQTRVVATSQKVSRPGFRW